LCLVVHEMEKRGWESFGPGGLGAKFKSKHGSSDHGGILSGKALWNNRDSDTIHHRTHSRAS